MNKKALIFCISGLSALLAIIIVSVVMLYSGDGDEDGSVAAVQDRADYCLVSAVPSDAAVLMSFKKFSSAVSALEDSSHVLGYILTDARRPAHPFRDFMDSLGRRPLGSLSKEPAVLSLHYIGNMEPVLILSAGKQAADTSSEVKSLLSIAAGSGLHSRFVSCRDMTAEDNPVHRYSLLLVSSSETLLTASVRHLESGASVFDKPSFSEAAASAGGDDILFISHDYISKLLGSDLLRPYSTYGSFFSKVADWTAFSFSRDGQKSYFLDGLSVADEKDQRAYINVLKKAAGGEQRFASAVPASALFALSISFADVASYSEAYRFCLDADGKLEKYGQACEMLEKEAGMKPSSWASSLDIKEVVKAVVPDGDTLRPLLYIRPGKENADVILRGSGRKSLKDCAEPYPNAYGGFAGALFGDFFKVDDSCVRYRDGWLVFGSARALSLDTGDKLKVNLSAMGMEVPGKEVNVNAYYSLSLMPSMLDAIFRPSLAMSLKKTLAGVTDEAALLTVKGSEVDFRLLRANVAPDRKAPVTAVKDTVVYVPSGPFEVTNSGTGKKNSLSQAANGSISLKDENGKGLWAIPFKGKLCGRVETIDYYNNGKLQFLFASGSKLYLLDRLGRFVKPFPVDLGKEIVLGPAAFDFTGAKGYTVLVLHSDNTVGMYDLHGRVKDGWKGIVSEDTIKSVPELTVSGGKKYWAVRTSVQLLFYDFMGGEPVVRFSGSKMIRPDSQIVMEDGNVFVTCFDGKRRRVKL